MADVAAGLDQAAPRRRTETGAARRELAFEVLRSKLFLAGSVVVGYWVFWAVAGSGLTPQDPLGNSDEVLRSPSFDHWFGTDLLGRDVFSRVHAGATETLAVAPLATLLGVVAGATIGMIAGYVAGSAVDEAIGRAIDAVLAIPLLVLAAVLIAALGITSTATQVLVIGLAFTPIVARTVRAAVLSEVQLDYVVAARVRGERPAYIMAREILPNVRGPIIVEATVRLGYAIFTVANLKFLGFGPQPPSPDWSLQIRESYGLLANGGYWWTVLFPALAICTLVVGVHLVTDGLHQVLDL